jgi:hypothetical protein
LNDHELGGRLRCQILSDLERGLPSDGRRLQALVGDLCGQEQRPLLPALKYLVMTPGFNNAVAQHPPLPADPRLQLRLQQELNEVFAAAISARMEAVLRGLMGLAAVNSEGMAPEEPPEREPDLDAEAEGETFELNAIPPSGGSRGLVAVLSFIAGVLVVGVGGGLAWLLLQSSPVRNPDVGDLSGSPARQDPAPSAAEPPTAPEPDLEAIRREAASTAQAVASVEQLYNDLSLGNIQAARQRFGGEAADQFDPAFFSQFQRVSVDNLRKLSRDGSLITLEGLVTFVYPDGTSQSESRSFTVETATDPALITASNFGQITRRRQ